MTKAAKKFIKKKRRKSVRNDAYSSPKIVTRLAENFLDSLPREEMFDLVITSPPYNIGKRYERRRAIGDYLRQQRDIIESIVERTKTGGSICWQVGNYVSEGEIFPLDFEFHKIFRKLGLNLRNRIIWRFGHGLHHNRRFSGRYEVILWYTKGDEWTFNLDAVRTPSKYPAKRHYKGPNKGEYSSHPMGKNPEDVWDTSPDLTDDVWIIPNVNGNHIEKTIHPCQFPIGLAERLVLALSNKGDLIFDPFAGVGSAGAAAVLHQRRFLGCEQSAEYARIGRDRIKSAADRTLKYRPHNRKIYDHKTSKLSIPPKR